MTFANATARRRYRVVDGSCLDCGGDVAGTLGRIPGVRSVEVFDAAGIVGVEHDGRVTDEQIERAARKIGLGLAPAEVRRPLERERPWWRAPKFLALAAGALLVVAGLAFELVLAQPGLALLFYAPSIAVAGFYPLKSALAALRERRLTITTLLVVAAIGAIALGVVGEAAELVVIFSLGEVLEDYVSDRARGSIRALMALAPPMALLKGPGGPLPTLVPVESLVPGDVVVVRPGERLPTDGRVVAGSSSVDQSPVTGESIPVEVTPGSGVFGGTVNGSGALEIEATKEWSDTTLARIIRQVEEAEAAKGGAERFADRFGAVYTPAMFVLAGLVAIVPPLLGGDLREWLYRALVVLAVSCSCALVISVPVSVVAGISRAARDGILIKGGVYLERLAGIRSIAFDKTGTLTVGRPTLTDVVALDGLTRDDALRLAAAVEAASEHPLAAAIVGAAAERGLAVAVGADLRALPGVGVEAMVDGRRLFVGRLNGRDIAAGAATEALVRLEREGKTAVVLADGSRPLAVLAVADAPREGAAPIIGELEGMGIERLVMLTGDNERTAEAIASRLGLREWRAGLLPEDKTAAIERLRAERGAIAMVGDGVNDAPALAVADVGIAMGAAGTDVALETADVALMADDLAKLPAALRLARRAMTNVRQNIALSLLTLAPLIVAALAGWLSLTAGVLLNEGSAILIIANGLRLLRAAEPAPPDSDAPAFDPATAAEPSLESPHADGRIRDAMTASASSAEWLRLCGQRSSSDQAHADDSEITTAIAVTVHEVAEPLAFANGLRAARA
ncbi:MAG: cadmium-translocating P-type ATPase [Anaerolinea sp.]|nr:cadmium-translocating P-type ATPase [Anaerolinea sp.]